MELHIYQEARSADKGLEQMLETVIAVVWREERAEQAEQAERLALVEQADRVAEVAVGMADLVANQVADV
jgi:uncharacterized protein YyaL (SSP411 family)